MDLRLLVEQLKKDCIWARTASLVYKLDYEFVGGQNLICDCWSSSLTRIALGRGPPAQGADCSQSGFRGWAASAGKQRICKRFVYRLDYEFVGGQNLDLRLLVEQPNKDCTWARTASPGRRLLVIRISRMGRFGGKTKDL